MKCQKCDKAATHHVTEFAAGERVEFHVCEAHVQELDGMKPRRVSRLGRSRVSVREFLLDAELRECLLDPLARDKYIAFLLPALFLALLDERPEVRIIAAFKLMRLGSDARSAVGALRDALQDQDARVRKAAEIALEHMESYEAGPWFFI